MKVDVKLNVKVNVAKKLNLNLEVNMKINVVVNVKMNVNVDDLMKEVFNFNIHFRNLTKFSGKLIMFSRYLNRISTKF